MSNMPDLSSMLEMLNNKGIDVNNIMQNFSNTNSSKSSDNNTPSLDDILNNASEKKSNNNANNDFQMPDMESMMKIMNLMNLLNSNKESPSANLLYSLKPFLRESKKEKVDQYVKFLKISSIINEINKSGGDFK